MATDNTSQVNTFTGGMNSDLSYSMITENQYIFAKNIRITGLNQTQLNDITNGQGEVRPIEGVDDILKIIHEDARILATGSLRDTGIIIYQPNNRPNAEDNTWRVVIFENEYNTGNALHPREIYNSGKHTNKNKLSTVLHYEGKTLMKLYIADGENPILCLNLRSGATAWQDGEEIPQQETESYPKVVFRPLEFEGLISGNCSMKAGMVQYAYVLNIKHGISTDMSPITNMIPIIDLDNGILMGGEYDKELDCGVKLSLRIDAEYLQTFDNILLYRIYHLQGGANPIIELIRDEELDNLEGRADHDGYSVFTIIDKGGTTSLLTYTQEEFNSVTGTHIIPSVIENKNDYMFAAAVVDVSSSTFNEITDELAEQPLQYEFVLLDLIGDASPNEDNIIKHNTYRRKANDSTWDIGEAGAAFRDKVGNNATYTNPILTYYARSLRRGETYRYGVIFYDERGQSSSVVRITDITVPEYNDDSGVIPKKPFTQGKYELEVHPIGIKFTVDNIPEGAVAYEIVRCRREFSDTRNISQGVIARPLYRYAWGDEDENIEPQPYLNTLTPSGFLTMLDFYYGVGNNKYGAACRLHDVAFNGFTVYGHADNYDQLRVLQFVSPEIAYENSDTVGALSKDMYQLSLTQCRNVYCNTGVTDRYVNFIHLGNRIGDNDWGSSVFEELEKERVENTNRYILPAAPNNARLLLDIPMTIHGNTHQFGDDVFSGKYELRAPAVGVENDVYPLLFYVKDVFRNSLSPREAPPGADNDGYELEGCTFSYVYPNEDSLDSTGHIETITTRLIMSSDIKAPKRNSYAYSKLYNTDDDFYSSIKSNPIKIDTSIIANNLTNPNAVFEKGEELNVKLSYMDGDNVQSIGSKLYNNIAIGGYYGENLLVEGTDLYTQTANLQYTPGNPECWMFAAIGGRCAVINVDQDVKIKHIDCELGTLDQSCSDDRYLYTTISNITKSANPYGGDSDTSKRLRTFYSHGQYFLCGDENSNNPIVFDGDTYIMPFEYVSMHKQYFAAASDTLGSMCMIYSIPVETSIHLGYTCGYEFNRNYNRTNNDGAITNILTVASTVYDVYSQDEDLYRYNSAYSSTGALKVSTTREKDEDRELQGEADFRVFWSELKHNGEDVDSWLKFQATNYQDVDSKHGAITHLRSFHNKLMFWLELATGVLSVNERVMISDESGLPLILGSGADPNGRVITRYDYLDDTTGMKGDQYCDTMSDSTLYWYDDSNNEIKAYRDGTAIIPLSKRCGVQNILHEYDDENIPWMFYDRKYGECILDLKKDHGASIVYNEGLDKFTSINDVGFDGCVKFRDGLYLFNCTGEEVLAGKWNKSSKPTGFDGPLSCLLRYVVNKFPVTTKVFDNLELVTTEDWTIEESIDRGSYFTKHHIYNWKTPLNLSNSSNLGMTIREGNYRFAIPRANNAKYGNRIRGKYMICDIEDTNPSKTASLSHVITKFRTSCI